MAALAAHPIQDRQLLHPRGYCISCAVTCAVCGKLMMVYRLNTRDGVHECSTCSTMYKIGINLFILPKGAIASQYLAPDEQLPPAERTAMGLRTRSRKRRQAVLRSVGLDDPVPQIAFNGAQRDSLVHSSIVVEPPKS